MQEEQLENTEVQQSEVNPIYNFQPVFTELGVPFNPLSMFTAHRLDGETYEMYRLRLRFVAKYPKYIINQSFVVTPTEYNKGLEATMPTNRKSRRKKF